MSLKTFKRYEKKFILNERQCEDMIDKLYPYTVPDKFTEQNDGYSIHNIYFDTANNDIIRNSLERPYYKEKLRLRSYNIPIMQEEIVFLEFKKKIGGIVSKRRASLPLREAAEFVRTGVIPGVKGYLNAIVLEEIARFLQVNDVEPKVFITYDRKAFFDKEDKSVRITFDRNIRTRRIDLTLQKGAYGKLLLEENPVILEVKFNKAIPLWLADILSEMKIYSTGFSKYGTEYEKFCIEKANPMESTTCFLPINTANRVALSFDSSMKLQPCLFMKPPSDPSMKPQQRYVNQ